MEKVLFGSICETQSGTRETVHDFAEMGTEAMRGCGSGRLWKFLQVEDDLVEGSKLQGRTGGYRGQIMKLEVARESFIEAGSKITFQLGALRNVECVE